jgi:anti-sigma-K factor RskA
MSIVNAWTLWQLNQSQDQLAATRSELTQMQGQVADAQTVIASLNGDSGSAAILRSQSGEAVLIAHLPQLQPGRVYQLFRIQGSNAPVSAAIFSVDARGYTTTTLSAGQQLKVGEIVTVTNEPEGGSPGPTTEPLITGTVNA